MQVSAYPHRATAEVFKAVADETRVRIVGLLAAAGELCVCDVEAVLGISQSRASRHLTTLRRAGVVADRRAGAWVHYSIPRRADPVVRAVLRAVRDALAGDPQARADVERAAELRRSGRCGGER